MFSRGMRTALYLYALALLFPISAVPAAQQSEADSYYHPSRRVGNIPDAAADAKAHGLQAIRIAPPIIESTPTPSDMGHAVSKATLAVVQVERTAAHFENKYQATIVTDVSFKVLTYISGQSTLARRAGRGNRAPQNIVVTVPGGALTSGGVEVTQPSEYPQFQPGQRYVVFLSTLPVDGGVVYVLPFGTDSLVGVNSDDSLQPSAWLKPNAALRRFIQDEGISSLSQLSTASAALRGQE
jgi:hypothetical protein